MIHYIRYYAVFLTLLYSTYSSKILEQEKHILITDKTLKIGKTSAMGCNKPLKLIKVVTQG